MQDPQADPISTTRANVSDAVKIQILATEHWSLLATRSLIWNEIFSRATMFLTTMSAATVALALVSQATDYGDDFTLFALLVLPLVLLLGIWTLIRMTVARDEDIHMVVGMNRLRHAYIDIAPDLEQYFITSCYDDRLNVLKTYSPMSTSRLARILGSTPVLVGAINAALIGVIAALVTEYFDHPPSVHVTVGAIAAVLAGALFIVFIPMRDLDRTESRLDSQFPEPAAASALAAD